MQCLDNLHCFPELKSTQQNHLKCFEKGQLSFMQCMTCKWHGKSLFETMRMRTGVWVCTYESWVRSVAWRFSLCVSRSIRSEPWSAVRELWEKHTQAAGCHFRRSIPIRDTHSYSAVKMLFFFREILPQFIPTNGSLHTSKSYGCLNGCTAHMYTLADTQGTHKHKQTHKEPCQGKRDQLPLQAW